ncbi:hypothetical protein [Gottfriedia luciferensis]|uniref:hypothetical protein n=1 Tax=Gottfriedia luciferensis TaxID=178774 RepID=UPI000B4409E2|nr:hypothetical protein [Gottfriedia luciferensis]
MTNQEKYILLGQLLKEQHYAIELMSEEQLKDYVELMSIFIKSNDRINQEASLSTMVLIVKNAQRNVNY